MNKSSTRNRSLLAAAIGAVLAFGALSQVHAQASQRAQERRDRQAQGQEKSSKSAAADQFPNATRQQPAAKASAKVTPKLQKMMKLYDDDKGAWPTPPPTPTTSPSPRRSPGRSPMSRTTPVARCVTGTRRSNPTAWTTMPTSARCSPWPRCCCRKTNTPSRWR